MLFYKEIKIYFKPDVLYFSIEVQHYSLTSIIILTPIFLKHGKLSPNLFF